MESQEQIDLSTGFCGAARIIRPIQIIDNHVMALELMTVLLVHSDRRPEA
jgi:hypothetical protein